MCSFSFTSQNDNSFQNKAQLLLIDLKESVSGSIFICSKIMLPSALKNIVMEFAKDEEIINVNLHNQFYFLYFYSFLRYISSPKPGFKHLGYNALFVHVCLTYENISIIATNHLNNWFCRDSEIDVLGISQ